MAFNLEAILKLRDKFSKTAKKAEKATFGLVGAANALKKAGKVAAGAVAAGYAAMSAAAVKAAQTAEESTRIIAVGSGATGEALDDLVESYRKVGRLVPDELTTVASALANMNTMTGATGETLEKLTKGIVDASRMLGEDASSNAASFGRALKQWQIPAEQGTEYLDKLFKATQDYGVGLGEISNILTGYGAILKNAGFEMDEAAHFFSILSQQGLSVSRIMPALNASFRRWAAQGKDSRKELQKVITTIQQTEDSQKALALATEVFGAQGAQRLMTAIRNGAIPALDELGSVFDNTSGLVEETNKATMKISDRFAMMRNRISIALEPIGRGLLDIADKAIPYLERGLNLGIEAFNWFMDAGKRAFESLKSAVSTAFPSVTEFSISIEDVGNLLQEAFARAEPYVEWFIKDGIPSAVQVVRELYDRAVEIYEYIAGNWTKFEPWIYGIVGAFAAYKAISIVLSAVIAIKTAAMTAFGAAVALATSPVFLIAAAIGALIGIGVLLYRNWDTITAKASEMWASIKETFSNIVNSISETMSGIIERMTAAWEFIKGLPRRSIEFWIELFSGLPSKIKDALSSIKNVFKNVGRDILTGISDGFTAMLDKLPKPVKWAIDQLAEGVKSVKKVGESLAGSLGFSGIKVDGSHYHGIDRVPYDGYIARLHKGERVLTADEAAAMDRGRVGGIGAGGITINIQNMHVRNDSDIDAVAEALFNRIKASWEAGA